MVAIVLGGFTLSAKWDVTKTISIAATPKAVYEKISHFKSWEEWQNLESNTTSTKTESSFSGISGEVGSKHQWVNATSGSGSTTMLSVNPNSGLSYDYVIEDGSMFTAKGEFSLKDMPPVVELTWVLTGDVGDDPIGRYATLFLPDIMGSDLQLRLNNLKILLEK
jgi:hypothetical protein